MAQGGQHHDLHGSCPDSCRVALLIIDMINGLEFKDSGSLRRAAEPMARRIAELARRARAARVPVIYVNDNFGRWRSDFNAIVDHVLHETEGRAIARVLRPHETDYFVLKPKHSGFFASSLDVLLHYLDARWLILTGMAGNICVLFTANDAYMRDYGVIVPEDCIASLTEEGNEHALTMMRGTLKADTTPSAELDLEAYLDPRRKSPRERVQR
jgi:nicotinamidase-related amidase